jgi:hypothetical protein
LKSGALNGRVTGPGSLSLDALVGRHLSGTFWGMARNGDGVRKSARSPPQPLIPPRFTPSFLRLKPLAETVLSAVKGKAVASQDPAAL